MLSAGTGCRGSPVVETGHKKGNIVITEIEQRNRIPVFGKIKEEK
jgi:hypothetical protein